MTLVSEIIVRDVDSLDLSLCNGIEIVLVALIEEVVGVEAQPHFVIALDELHHLLAVLAQACAWKVLDAECRSDLLGNRCKLADGLVAALKPVCSFVWSNRFRARMKHDVLRLEHSSHSEHVLHVADDISPFRAVYERDIYLL